MQTIWCFFFLHSLWPGETYSKCVIEPQFQYYLPRIATSLNTKERANGKNSKKIKISMKSLLTSQMHLIPLADLRFGSYTHVWQASKAAEICDELKQRYKQRAPATKLQRQTDQPCGQSTTRYTLFREKIQAHIIPSRDILLIDSENSRFGHKSK